MTAKQRRIYKDIYEQISGIYGYTRVTKKMDMLIKTLTDYIIITYKPKREKDFNIDEETFNVFMKSYE